MPSCVSTRLHTRVTVTFIVYSDNVGAEPRLVSSVVSKKTKPGSDI